VTTVDEVVAERLQNATFEERFGELGVGEAKTLFRCSKAEVYRRVANGTLAHLKAEGASRKGHGKAGRLTFLLEHIVRYQVERERAPGRKQSGPKAA
jgi:hypothetical protein